MPDTIYFDPVADFGAPSNGATDSVQQWDNLLAALRDTANEVDANEPDHHYKRFVVDGRGRTFSVSSSLNFTGIRQGVVTIKDCTFNWIGTFDADNGAVLDLTGSRNLTFIDVHVRSLNNNKADIGWLQGREAKQVNNDWNAAPAGTHTFVRCSAIGYFRVGWANVASEVCSYFDCTVLNYHASSGAYAAVFQKHLIVPLKSVHKLLVDTTLHENSFTFTLLNMQRCEWRMMEGTLGTALLLNNVTRLDMKACYATAWGYTGTEDVTSACCVIDHGDEAEGMSTCSDVDLELHMEGEFANCWVLRHHLRTAKIDNFRWYEHSVHAKVACFRDSNYGQSVYTNNFFIRPQISSASACVIFRSYASNGAEQDLTYWAHRDAEIQVLDESKLPDVAGFAEYSGDTVAISRTPKRVSYHRWNNATATTSDVNGLTTTCNGILGLVTTPSLNSAGSTYKLEINNTLVVADDFATASVWLGSATTGLPAVATVTPTDGKLTIVIFKADPSATINGTVKVGFHVHKRS